jgi:hypothetical protein
MLAAGSCDAPTMTAEQPGYNPVGVVPVIYHWRPGHDIAIYVDLTNAVAGTDLEAAVREGINVWREVGRLGEVRMHITRDLRAADVIVHHSTAPRLAESDVCPPFPTGAGGYTLICVDENNVATNMTFVDGRESHVKMDVSVNRAAATADSVFRSFVIHELGHVLGIGAHSPNQADLMFGSPRRLVPTAADASTLRYVLSRKADILF